MRDARGVIRLPMNATDEERRDYVKRLRAAFEKRGLACVEMKMVVRFASGGRMECAGVPQSPQAALASVKRLLDPVIRSALQAERAARKNKEKRRNR